jgi:hypothetical protein
MDVGVVNLRDDVRDCLADAGEFVGRSSAMIWGSTRAARLSAAAHRP